MRVLLLGDSHGRLDIVHRACRLAQERQAVEAALQVGDAGFFPSILKRFLTEGPRRFPIPLHVIDGNHEDHGWLHDCRRDGTMASWEAANLLFHGRGTTAELGGRRWGFLGGALHADRRQEWAGQWHPDRHGLRRASRDPAWANWITEGDVDRAVSAFSASPPEILVTHTCPAGIGIGMVGELSLIKDVERFIVRAGHHSGPFHDCGEGHLTRLWRALPARPRLWIFGHFHRFHRRQVDGTDFLCCGVSDRIPVAPLLILDTTSLEIAQAAWE